jgi:hypothetical protein
MKISRAVVCLICLGLFQSITSHARELYAMSWKGTVYKSNGSGVVAMRYSEKDIIAKVAADNGITDVKSLAFVYVADEQDTEVVFAATGEYVADVFQLEISYVDVPTANGLTVVRQAFIFNEAHDQALGSAFGIQHNRFSPSGERIGVSYKGNFQFSIPEDGAVYSGTFATGKRLRTSS